MRSLGLIPLILAACGTDAPSETAVRTYDFGPFTVQPQQEISDQCVQITLHNDQPIYVNTVELTTGTGFHHSNWFFVPETTFVNADGSDPDGTFTCTDRNFDQAVAGIRGGVLFAQSTQSAHDVQAFPAGVAVKIPARSKLVSTIHLLNTGDAAVMLAPKIALTPIAEASVATLLTGMSFEDHALGLPPQKQSRFTVDCDLTPEWQILYGQGAVTSDHPDFKIYYALAHYHTMGTGMTIEGVKGDGTAATIYTTTGKIGDSLGATIDPVFDFNGYTRIRFSCDYFNNTNATVPWGIGSNEMCVFLGFSDSKYTWGGGETIDEAPTGGTDVNGTMTYTAPCQVYAHEENL